MAHTMDLIGFAAMLDRLILNITQHPTKAATNKPISHYITSPASACAKLAKLTIRHK